MEDDGSQMCTTEGCTDKCRKNQDKHTAIVCDTTCEQFVKSIRDKTPLAVNRRGSDAEKKMQKSLEDVYRESPEEPGGWSSQNPFLRVWCLSGEYEEFESGSIDAPGAEAEQLEVRCAVESDMDAKNTVEPWKSLCKMNPQPWLQSKVRTFTRPSDDAGAKLADAFKDGSWQAHAKCVWGKPPS
jgi:hypothetical protein